MKEIYLLRLILVLILSMPVWGAIIYKRKRNDVPSTNHFGKHLIKVGFIIILIVFTYFFFNNDSFATQAGSFIAALAALFGVGKDSYLINKFLNKKNK